MLKYLGKMTQILLLGGGCLISCSAQQTTSTACDAVRSILDDASSITINTTRADLEKSFTVGSFSFRGSATYVSRKCRYVAVDVEFEPDDSSPGPPAPTDRVKKVSKPYLAYPGMD